jgi:hypothetical protein
MIRLEWRGGVYEEFDSLDLARRVVLVIFPRAVQGEWHTTDDGNYRCLSFWEEGTRKIREPVARILIPLS